MLKEENIRTLSDSELLEAYGKWHEYFFEVVLIMNDEVSKRGLEMSNEAQEYIKTEVKKIRKSYKGFTDKELRLEYQNFENLGYAHQMVLEKEMKSRNIKENSSLDKIVNEENSYFLKAYGLAGVLYALIWLSQVVLHLVFEKMGVMSDGYLMVERYIYDFLYTIPLIMIFQLEGNYREFHVRTKSYYNVGFNHIIYITIYFSLIGLLFKVLAELNMILAIIAVIYAVFKTSLAPYFIIDEDMQLSYACQKSFELTKEKFGRAFIMFIIFCLLLGVYNILPDMYIGGNIFISMGIRFFSLIIASFVVKLYVKFYYKKF